MRYRKINRTGLQTTYELRASMREIAAHSGVSLKTVSRVINNEAGVTAATQERVRRSIAALNGPASEAGAAPVFDYSGQAIGVVVDRIGEPFQSAVAESIEAAAQARGYFAFVASSQGDPEREIATINTMASNGVAGIVLVPSTGGRSHQVALAKRDTRVVLVDRVVPDAGLDTVHADNVGGASEGVRHLVERGHKRIAILGSETTIHPIRERLQGYRQTLLDFGISVDPSLIFMRSMRDGSVETALRQLAALKDPPTAVFAASGRYAIEVVRCIHDRKTNLALVGFDDFPLSDVVLGGVTVVSQHPKATGQTAFDTLLQRIQGDLSQPRKILIGTDLLVRNSSSQPPAPLVFL